MSMSGENCLSIGIDLEQWKKMSQAQREEHVFFCLRDLIKESKRNRLIDRLITFAGAMAANITVMAPLVWWLVSNH